MLAHRQDQARSLSPCQPECQCPGHSLPQALPALAHLQGVPRAAHNCHWEPGERGRDSESSL
eukprot:2955964-Rhodomonas_salina.2